MMTKSTKHSAPRTAVFMACVGVFWVAVTWAGQAWEWTNRTRALFDLFALAGFGAGLWMTYTIWRARRNDKG